MAGATDIPPVPGSVAPNLGQPAEDEEWNNILREASKMGGNIGENVEKLPVDERTGRPDYSGGTAAAVGTGQGLTAGWSAKGGALVDTFLSKAPPALREQLEKWNAAGGGHPGLSPLTEDKTFSQRLAEYNQRNGDLEATHGGPMHLGQLVGGVGLGALGPTAATSSVPGALGRGAAGGAVAGAGYSKGDPTTTEGRKDIAIDSGVGAGIGGALGVAGHAIGKLGDNSGERVDRRIVRDAAKGAGPYEQKLIVEKAPRVAEVIKDEPTIKAALGDPKKMQEVLKPRMSEIGAENDAIYAKALEGSAKSGGSGVPDTGIQSVFDHAREQFKAGTKAQIAKIDAIEEQFKRLGNNPAPAQVREFVSDYLHGPATAANPLHAGETTDTQKVLQSIGDGVKEKLHAYVGLHSPPGTVAKLEANNEKLHVMGVLKDATKDQRFQVERPGGENKSGLAELATKAIHGVGPPGVGAGLGAAAAHLAGVDPVQGAIAGAAAGEGARRLAKVADKAVASKIGQWSLFGLGRAASKAIPQPVIDAATQMNDPRPLQQHLQDSIFGDDKEAVAAK